ncbi:hypothetical protein QVD17_29185 [Tagetes erecta]|uniref:Amino acid transporter transmembrane domain-containing protein n=1 Tax=Tagetes erecta TaxID=13708 RepID=A0AAD8NSX3_TARER|nr:hypothetical protein QVD17_29185 [Tagetes erecta]
MGITTGLFIVIAFMGYGMYGRDVKGAFTLNLPTSSTLCKTIILFTGVEHFLRYFQKITPVVRALVEEVPQTWEHRNRYQIFISILAVLITIAPAVLYTHHDKLYVEIVTFGGAILGVLLAFLAPAACFLKINWSIGITRTQGTCAAIVLVTGVVGATMTTVKSIRDWKS